MPASITITSDQAARALKILHRNGGTDAAVAALLDYDESPPAKESRYTDAVRIVLDEAEDVRGAGPFTGADARKQIAKLLDGAVPEFLTGADLAALEACDVPAMVDRLVTDCEEIDIRPEHIDRIDIVWRRKAGAKMGLVDCGSLKPVGKRERQTWRGAGPAPFWRLTLGLDVWILMTEAERWRLVHHELMHATYKQGPGTVNPAGRGHDIEEHAATLARYGAADERQAQTLAQHAARPNVGAELLVYGVDPATGQGLLFGRELTAVGVAS